MWHRGMRRTGNKALNGTRAQDDGLGGTKTNKLKKKLEFGRGR